MADKPAESGESGTVVEPEHITIAATSACHGTNE